MVRAMSKHDPFSYVSGREIARRYDVTPRTVSKWARTARIPSIRVSSRCIRFDLDAVQQAIAVKRSATACLGGGKGVRP